MTFNHEKRVCNNLWQLKDLNQQTVAFLIGRQNQLTVAFSYLAAESRYYRPMLSVVSLCLLQEHRVYELRNAFFKYLFQKKGNPFDFLQSCQQRFREDAMNDNSAWVIDWRQDKCISPVILVTLGSIIKTEVTSNCQSGKINNTQRSNIIFSKCTRLLACLLRK